MVSEALVVSLAAPVGSPEGPEGSLEVHTSTSVVTVVAVSDPAMAADPVSISHDQPTVRATKAMARPRSTRTMSSMAPALKGARARTSKARCEATLSSAKSHAINLWTIFGVMVWP